MVTERGGVSEEHHPQCQLTTRPRNGCPQCEMLNSGKPIVYSIRVVQPFGGRFLRFIRFLRTEVDKGRPRLFEPERGNHRTGVFSLSVREFRMNLIYQAVLRTGDVVMPPKDRNRLTAPEARLLRDWINAGAPWPKTVAGVSSPNTPAGPVSMSTSGGRYVFGAGVAVRPMS